MDALSDPRAFLSAQEKRAQQLKQMGIEESDIATADAVKKAEATAKKGIVVKGKSEEKKGNI